MTLVIGRAGAESESASESESDELEEDEVAGMTGTALRIGGELEEEVGGMTGTALRIGGEFSSSSSVTVEEPEEALTLVICRGGPEKEILKSFRITLLSDLMQLRSPSS